MIYILTGPVRSGKTSILLRFIQQSDQRIGGFISPDTHNKRTLYHIDEKKSILFETDQESNNTIAVGRYLFFIHAFKEASDWTTQQLSDASFSFFIIDEIGKLELNGQGFHALFQQILKENWEKRDLVVVVRYTLVFQIIEQYEITQYTILLDMDHFKIGKTL